MVGRKKEIEELNRIYNSNRAQLVAVYGRRRVGKTYLVDEAFKGKMTFRHAGLSPKMIIHNTLITTYGLKYNEYSSDFDNVITLDDIFVI